MIQERCVTDLIADLPGTVLRIDADAPQSEHRFGPWQFHNRSENEMFA